MPKQSLRHPHTAGNRLSRSSVGSGLCPATAALCLLHARPQKKNAEAGLLHLPTWYLHCTSLPAGTKKGNQQRHRPALRIGATEQAFVRACPGGGRSLSAHRTHSRRAGSQGIPNMTHAVTASGAEHVHARRRV